MIYITILSIAALTAVIFAFKEGYKLGLSNKTIIENEKPNFVNVIKSKVNDLFNSDNDTGNLETDEQRKANIELENIDNYGTNKPQKEVK